MQIGKWRVSYQLTLSVIGVTSIITILQFIDSDFLSFLRRDPEALAAGEWWRILSPLLVHPHGWSQFLFNMLGILVIGMFIERLYGKKYFIILYVSGALIGEISGLVAWDPYGAGASLGLSGLLGGLFIWLIQEREHVPALVTLFSLFAVIGLTVATPVQWVIFWATFLLLGVMVFFFLRSGKKVKMMHVVGGFIGIGEGVWLFFLQDTHGAALIAGICAAVIIMRIMKQSQSRRMKQSV